MDASFVSGSPFALSIVVSLATGAWCLYFTQKAWHFETAGWPSVAAVLGGVLAVGFAFGAFSIGDALGVSPTWDVMATGRIEDAVSQALTIGLVEEVAKMLPLLAFACFGQRFTRPRQALLLAALAGVGFAAAESSLMFWGDGVPLTEGLARAAAAPVTHALFAAPWGLGIGGWVLRGKIRPFLQGGLVSVVCHAAYDLSLARAGVPNVFAISVVLALWGWLILRTAPRVSRSSALRALPVVTAFRRVP